MMKQFPRSPRAALFIGAALFATPAFAQDTQTVTPPPVVSTAPPQPAPAPAPTIVYAPPSPTVQPIPVPPEPVATTTRAERPAPRTATRTTTTTTTRQTTRAATPAPAAVAPAAPAPETPPVETVQPAPVPEAVTPIETVTTDTAQTTTTAPAESPRQIWPWLLIGALIVAGAVIALLMRRRREDDAVYEPYQEPVAEVAPVPVREPAPRRAPAAAPRHEPEVVAAAPLAAAVDGDDDFGTPAADAELHAAEREDLAGLTKKAPVSDRPWLEFGMRPVRAGTSADEALVEIELTIGNAGDTPAKDVRISTFMFANGQSSDIEQLMIEHGDDAAVPPVTIAPGEGTRVDATLAVRKATLAGEDAFNPVVVADARYTLPDGSEGRTSASFRVGLWNEGEHIEPIALGRPEMHRNVAAELHGTPAHA